MRIFEKLDCENTGIASAVLNQDLIDDARVVNCEVLAYGIDERRPCKVTAMGGDGLIIDVPLRVKSKC
jgi:hypothetical protein